MKKIISLFQRNYDGDRLIRNKVTPGAEWVLSGEGYATRKWDGTCVLFQGGKMFKRFEVKPGGTPPVNFEPANSIDQTTGKQQGWIPVSDGPEDRWHREAGVRIAGLWSDGTYELIGPKINGNPEKVDYHLLIRHGVHKLNAPRSFLELKEYLQYAQIEGIVWYHPDGRMVK